jgi:hypothetical protein
MHSHLTFSREVSARGFLGTLRQRGLEITYEPGSANVALLAYTPSGTSTAARLEVPADDLRRFARMLLDIADATSGTNGLRPARQTLDTVAALRRAG